MMVYYHICKTVYNIWCARESVGSINDVSKFDINLYTDNTMVEQ